MAMADGSTAPMSGEEEEVEKRQEDGELREEQVSKSAVETAGPRDACLQHDSEANTHPLVSR